MSSQDSPIYSSDISDMNYLIDVQIAWEGPLEVSEETIIEWAKLPLINDEIDSPELTIRLVEKEEIIYLNSTYRKIPKPTNVLAFPSSVPKEIELSHLLLGDVIICPEVLQEEAAEQRKPLQAHFAHITIHGVLHLLGYDHIQEVDFKTMKALEIKLLAKLGFPNPYID